MKKYILSIALCGGGLVASTASVTVHADDSLTGTTSVSSEVVKGDITLAIDNSTDFGQQPLSDVVDFGTKDINYTVTDFTGTTDGFTIAAKLTDIDSKRSLKLGGIELSDIDTPIIQKATDTFGDNKDKVSAALKYTGVNQVKVYTSSIEWSLTKGTTAQFKE